MCLIRDVTVANIDTVDTKNDEVSYTRPPKKANTSSTNKSANVTYNSSQDISETSAADNAFDVGSEKIADWLSRQYWPLSSGYLG